MDFDIVSKTIDVVFEPGSVAELRLFGTAKGTISGYFDNPKDLASAAAQYDGEAPGVYVTLNPVNPDLLARACNCAKSFAKQTTGDREIAKRRWMLIDFDPKRPSGISSTDEEHAAALERARECRDHLTVAGWPAPIFADSGNGAHLLYRIDLPNDPESRDLLKHCLEALDLMFSDNKVDVDRKTYNASRISKLYGTMCCKGDDAPERPHRVSMIVDRPEDVGIVSVEMLRALEGTIPAGSHPKGDPANSEGFDLDEFIASHADKINVVREGDWDGTGRKYILNPCPWNPDHTNASAYIVRFASGATAAGCHHNGCSGNHWHELRDLVQPGWRESKQSNIRAKTPRLSSAIYRSTPEGLVVDKSTSYGVVTTPLTNFDAKIVGEIDRFDGIEHSFWFVIRATLPSGEARTIKIPVSRFNSMNWPMEELGAGAIVYAGNGARDHARVAIQTLSTGCDRKRVFIHTGWAEVDGQMLYLHSGGAVGADGSTDVASVELSDELALFELPDLTSDCPDLPGAIRASLGILDVAPDVATVPLLASTYMAASGQICDLTVIVTGRTGYGKTELASLCQRHFGKEMDARHLPSSWDATPNHRAELRFLAKDVIVVVDDYCPGGSGKDLGKLNREADSLVRSQGNRSARGRMKSDLTLQKTRPPRGMVISTGEDNPTGASLRARAVIVELENAVDWMKMTPLQDLAASGALALSMAGFVRYIARDFDARRKWFKEQSQELRKELPGFAGHRRTGDNAIKLIIAWRLFLDYAESEGAISVDEHTALAARGENALLSVGRDQAQYQAESDPVNRYLELIAAALRCGEAHVASTSGERPDHSERWGWHLPEGPWRAWEPLGKLIGWTDGPNLCLDPHAAYAVVKIMAERTGEPFATSIRTMHKRLHERGLLIRDEQAKRKTNTVRMSINGTRAEVLHLSADRVLEFEDDQTDQSDQEAAWQA